MLVRELIKELKQYDQDLPVHFSYPYGDHWNTTVVPEINDISEDQVKYSSYYNNTVLPRDNEDDKDDSFIDVLILS
jgi:hypothetical protein